MTRSFPDGFRWGTATAAHQIEGGNWNNDWWRWEHTPGSGCAEPSGDACDSWHRWATDVDLVAELGFDSYRFSVEWSRIEPEPGEWSAAAVDHYRRQCEALLAVGVEPVVTFHHFTTPRWLADHGGWTEPDTASRFAAYCERLAGELGPVMRRACTINEPNIVAVMGYLFGAFPPGEKDSASRHRANEVLAEAHRQGVEAIRATAPGVPIGLTVSTTDYQAATGGEATRDKIRRDMEDVFLDATAGDDFVGVQTYTRMLIGPDGWIGPEPGVDVLPMGYEYWPDALGATIRRVWEYTKGQVPILVTENGIGTDDDDQRTRYVQRALDGVLDCVADGIDVLGYTYWSLLDNFEWAFGYGPHFGLVSVDRTTFERTPKPSARWLGAIARANALPNVG
ncbi:MAG: glycoside hydrolase family 1 protein [Acidimicrobiales bacterium]